MNLHVFIPFTGEFLIDCRYTFTGAFKMKMKNLDFSSISVRSNCEMFSFFYLFQMNRVHSFWALIDTKGITNSSFQPLSSKRVCHPSKCNLFRSTQISLTITGKKYLLKPVITCYFYFLSRSAFLQLFILYTGFYHSSYIKKLFYLFDEFADLRAKRHVHVAF